MTPRTTPLLASMRVARRLAREKGVVPPEAAFALVLNANLGTALNPLLEGAIGGDPMSKLSAQDIGAGTEALPVLRSVGGASGSILAGAIVASGLIAIRRAATATPNAMTNSLH